MSLIAGRGCRWPPRRDSVSPCAPLSGGRDTHDGHENSPILVFFSNLLHTVAALSAAHPDRTLAALKDALATPASVPTVWRAVRALGLTVTKNGPPVRTRSA